MDDKKAEAIARGKRAELLLKDDLLADSLAKLEESYIKGWKETAARDTDARERFFLAVQVVGKVRGHLTSLVSNGKLTQSEIDDLATASKPKRFGIV